MGPKRDNASSNVKRKNSNIMIDVKKEIIAKTCKRIPLSDNYISLPDHLHYAVSSPPYR
jgi:hypothetical protein